MAKRTKKWKACFRHASKHAKTHGGFDRALHACLARNFGGITRSREKVEKAVLRSITRPGKPFPEHAARSLQVRVDVYRVRGYGKQKLYQGWMCILGLGGGTKRLGQSCGEAKGPTPTAAIAAAAHDFARTIKKR